MNKRDDWEKPRSHGTKLTEVEIDRIKLGFVRGERIEDVARELAAASRTVSKYYGFFRAEGVHSRGSGAPIRSNHRRDRPLGGIVRMEPRPMTEADLRRYRERQPRDTRDLTSRILGDPLPGRSALDQRRAMR
jgi:hypothetical protein